jgi:very-short-patch-repair endonuclease
MREQMKNFAKSILNYFATYNETRFNFRKKIPYAWSDDEFTLDFCVFPEFQKQLLNSIQEDKALKLEVEKEQYTIQLDQDKFKNRLLENLDSDFDEDYLNSCLEKAKEQLSWKKNVVVDEAGNAKEADENKELDKKFIEEGLRLFNLAFRKAVGKVLLEIQEEEEENLKKELGYEKPPLSSFNPKSIEQEIFDNLQRIAGSNDSTDSYISEITDYLKESEFKMVMYDLYLMLNSFLTFVNAQSIFLFFHEISKEGTSYPVFFLEVDIKNVGGKIIVEKARDILMINTPAINYFKFGNVLTTPRACLLQDAERYLRAIDQFLQAYYRNPNEILLQPNFKKLVAEDLPQVSYRVGLQLLDEDRKILDYSELITQIDEGAGEKFTNLIADYVEKNVENTTDEVHKQFKKEYPKKSVKNLVSAIPMNLNDSQKKVLTAVKNEKNRIIKVEGPPGTGKSYTITALVYLANLMGKSVLISSHKKQALDVVEEKLTSQFSKLHPRAKPSVLRLTTPSNKGETVNNLDNTLASTVIDSATERALEFNSEAIENDKEQLLQDLEKENQNFWKNAQNYVDYTEKSFQLAKIEKELFEKKVEIESLEGGINFEITKKLRDMFSLFQNLQHISWDDFKKLFENKGNIDALIESCNQLNKSEPQFSKKQIRELNVEKIRALQKIIRELKKYCNQGVKLQQFDFETTDLKELKIAGSDIVDSYDGLEHALGILEKYQALSKGLKKLLPSKQKKEILEAIKEKLPAVNASIKKGGVKKAFEKIESLKKSVDNLHSKVPFLTKDYILNYESEKKITEVKVLCDEINKLEYKNILEKVAELSNQERSNLTLGLINQFLNDLLSTIEYYKHEENIKDISQVLNQSSDDLVELYRKLEAVKGKINKFDEKTIEKIDTFVFYYGKLFPKLEIDKNNIETFTKFAGDSEQINKFWHFVKLHQEVSKYDFPEPPDSKKIKEFNNKVQKLLEHKNDNRLKNLLNYQGDVQRILTAINSGKRISEKQARVLFESLSCIIAPPKLISEYFPMEEDMVDILIIDEASQVSIAESVSLILRAAQTIVFGDELQYGAVEAVNVSKKYSKRYFKDILENYEKDKNDAIQDEVKERLADEVSQNVPEEERTAIDPKGLRVTPNQKEWLKTFGIRTSTLSFAEALANYKTSLNVHFRSFPEIIDYSNEVFYKPNQINLITNRIRTKPISQVLRFIKVETKGLASRNVNLDEIEAIKKDLEELVINNYKGSIGIICSFKEQTERMEEILSEELESFYQLKRENNLEIWFVGKVQGIERDIIYYSFVEDRELGNGSLKHIYPVVGGTADNIRNLQKQRLNVGFSRAKDTMVFVHSMPLEKYRKTCLGEALKHYQDIFETTKDTYIEDESIFGSPAEKKLYSLITQTDFYKSNRERLRLIPQFEIGKYIQDKYHKYIPGYRVDFLLTLSEQGKEQSLIIEYDGVEYHFEDPETVTKHNFDQEYIEYDIQRQLELEQYGYSFLRINKFNLMPKEKEQTQVYVLNNMLLQRFN